MQIFRRLSNELIPSRASIRTVLIAAFAMTALGASSFATPAEEIARAVVAGGASDITQARSKQFVRAFTAVTLRTPQRELPAYVAAAIDLRPDLSPKIVAAAIKVAVKHWESKPGTLCEMIDRIIRAAVAANPEAVLSIARAAAEVSPGLRHCVASSAVAAAREQGSADPGLTMALLSFGTHQPTMEGPGSFGTGTINPANISDLRQDSPVNSPEQPPTD